MSIIAPLTEMERNCEFQEVGDGRKANEIK